MIYILTLVVFLVFIYGYKKYHTGFNPLSVTALIYGFFSGLSYFSTIILRIDSINFPIDYLDLAIAISTVSILAFTIPFFLRLGVVARLFNKALDKISRTETASQSLSLFGFISLSLVSLGAYLSLVFFTDGGILWVTNPREAYLNHRSGFGAYYIFYLYSLIILFLYSLYMWRPRFWGLSFITIGFFFLALYSGKKAFALSFVLISLCYYNFNVRKLSLKSLIFCLAIILTIVVFLIYIGTGVENTSFDILLDYFNYGDITAEFLYRHEEFGYYFGKAFLTSFWVLVPRSLYPEKPFEYGASLVHQIINPGLAETGHTAGYFMWISSYLDFGIMGVITSFILQGWLSRVIYEWYISRKDTIFSFVFMMHFSIIEIWYFLPGPFAFLMCLVVLLTSALFSKKSTGLTFHK